jgi:hypothetical protein
MPHPLSPLFRYSDIHLRVMVAWSPNDLPGAFAVHFRYGRPILSPTLTLVTNLMRLLSSQRAINVIQVVIDIDVCAAQVHTSILKKKHLKHASQLAGCLRVLLSTHMLP